MKCDRCRGSGQESMSTSKQRCRQCLGLGSYAPRVKRERVYRHPDERDHLIAVHSAVLDFDEMVELLPVRKEVDDE